MMKKQVVIGSALLMVGLIVLGIFIDSGLTSISKKDRVVTVRGLAEKEVKADLVLWPIVYKITGNDLHAIYAQINESSGKIASFLKKNGIPAADISQAAPQIADLQADRYNDARGKDRYNVTLVLTVSSAKVDEVRGLMSRMGELLAEGIAISSDDGSYPVQYSFNSLNKIKPQMIEEATHNARQAAEKFAKDSESTLGKIKSAQQGLFTIDSRDPYTPYIKEVRVVTTIDYYLKS